MIAYWQFSGFYFFYFAFVGAFSPYFSLYLKNLQFSAQDIGILMSLLQVMRIFGPNVWGVVADRTTKKIRVVQIAAFIALISYMGLYWVTNFWPLFIILSIMSFFWSASLPIVESLTLSALGKQAGQYGKIRLWGSVGFIVAVLLLGWLFDFYPLSILIDVILFLKIGIILFTFLLPPVENRVLVQDTESIWRILKQPTVLALMFACFFMSIAHGPYYIFYSLYLVDLSYSKTMVGVLWALGVIAEIFVFLWMSRITQYFDLKNILIFSFAVAVLRFLCIAWGAHALWLMIFAQLLHAFTFGTFHAAAVALVHHFFRGKHQAKGQALYISFSFGAGGTLGGLYSGYTWEHLGPTWTFSIAALSAFLGLVLLIHKLKVK